jgi:hypothetical protein
METFMSRPLNGLETIGATIVATALIGNGWTWMYPIPSLMVVFGGFVLGVLVAHVIETDNRSEK